MQSFMQLDGKPVECFNRWLPFSSGETATEYHLHHAGYSFGITLLGRSFLRKKPPFLFLSPCSKQKQIYRQSFATHISRSCLRPAIIIHSSCSDNVPATIFEAFAAIKWICRHAKLLGIDTSEMPLVGTGQGAHTATVISMMASSETGVNLGGKVLVDPGFYRSGELTLQESGNGNKKSTDEPTGNWINMQDVYDLPFTTGSDELKKQPPTLFQFTQNALWDQDSKTYYGRLVEAGAAVNCVCYECVNRFSTAQVSLTIPDLLRDLASALG